MAAEHSVRQLVEELSNAALRDLLRNVRHHTELRRRISTGVIDERWVNVAYRDYARREGPSYRQQAAELTQRYYSDLADLGNQYSERFYGEVLDGAATLRTGSPNGDRWEERFDPSASAATPAAPVEEIPIELHGPPGREVVARFGLENTEAHQVQLTVDVGPCHGPNDERFHAPISVQPAELTLHPGETRQVTMRLLMSAALFVPGYLYRLAITVRGAEEMRLLVTIWAEEPDVGLRIDASPPEAVVPPEPEPEPEPEQHFVVRCTRCKREFRRDERSTRVYPHKAPDGEPCPGRTGRVRATS